MAKVPDSITLKELCTKAAQALARAGLDRRIDIYREIEIDDPAVRLMLGRPHKLRVRVKITASSLLFENTADRNRAAEAAGPDTVGEGAVVGSIDPITTTQR
jgi:hypothetical protein